MVAELKVSSADLLHSMGHCSLSCMRSASVFSLLASAASRHSRAPEVAATVPTSLEGGGQDDGFQNPSS